MDKEKYETFKVLGDFQAKVFDFIVQSLEDVKNTASASTVELMDRSISLSKLSGDRKAQAEQMIQDAHLSPDAEIARELEQNQADVDSIFEQAQQDHHLPHQASNEEASKAKSRREGSKFSKNIEAISKYEDRITEILMSMAGSLSNEDVIKQLIENAVLNIRDYMNFIRMFPQMPTNAPTGKEINFAMSRLIASAAKRHRGMEENRMLDQAMKLHKTALSDGERVNSIEQIHATISFMVAFETYIKDVIHSIKSGYSDIVESATSAILEISSSAGDMKEHANSIMVKNSEGTFRNESLSEFEASEKNLFSAEEGAKNTAKVFQLPQNILSEMDDGVSDALTEMMGCLSIGDVIGQRIANLDKCCNAVLKILEFAIENLEDKFNTNTIQLVNQQCYSFIFKSFVTEDEKALLKSIMPDKNAA